MLAERPAARLVRPEPPGRARDGGCIGILIVGCPAMHLPVP